MTLLQFSDLSDGHHGYTVVARDRYGFSASNQLSFTTESGRQIKLQNMCPYHKIYVLLQTYSLELYLPFATSI